MERLEREITTSILNRLSASLKEFGLKVKQEDRWKTALLIRRFDLVVYRNQHPVAVIEVKTNLQNKNILAIATDQIRSALSITNSRYGVVTDGEQYYIYDISKKELDFVSITYQDLLWRLSHPDEISVSRSTKEDVLRIIKQAVEIYLSENVDLRKFINSKDFLNRIQFDNDSNSFHFSGDDSGISSFENQFFIKMFGVFKDTKVCRYTSLSTVFQMLNNLSFRMSGLMGMNDKSEVDYVETYLNGTQKSIINEHHSKIRAVNRRYITSCTDIDRKDDLTLWRLYADDAKGVCMIFNVNKKNLNNQVLLQRVKYADEDGNHKELDFLKRIKEDVERITGYRFDFRKLGYWKHFFKPHDYAVEEEVRLLIIDNGSLPQSKPNWVMTYTHSIINPIIDFSLNSSTFPIQLREIIIGPKCPENETNKVQLEEMIRRKKNQITIDNLSSNLNYLNVELSEITHYR